MNRPYRRLESKTEYHWRQYALVSERIELDDGRELTKHTLKHPGAVLIVPTFEDGSLLMVHQYRHAIDQYLLEFPAGTLEQSEPVSDCARRELIEETGYDAQAWRELGILHPAPGFCDEIQYCFLASDLEPAEIAPDADEFIEVRRLPVAEVEQAIVSGEMTDAKSIALFARARAANLV
jgi:ADP-ribose pyrophosphatase